MFKHVKLLLVVPVLALAAACTTTDPDYCAVNVRGDLESAMRTVETKLGSGCEYQFDSYFHSLLAIAEATLRRQCLDVVEACAHVLLVTPHLKLAHARGVDQRRARGQRHGGRRSRGGRRASGRRGRGALR